MKLTKCAVILLVSLTPLLGFCQDKVITFWHQGQTKYILTESHALNVVELHIRDSINTDKVIALEANKDTLEVKIGLLESQLTAKDSINSANDGLLEVEKERTDLSKKEVRRLKRKAVGQWFKDKWKMFVIGVGAFGFGAGVGFAASK